jgi:GTP-binding protein
MLYDRAKIYIKSGDGGRGALSFHREKFVPNGGPDGGDGGRGGDVVLEVDDQMASLIPYKFKVHFKATNGEGGKGRNQFGKQGEDVVLKVPPGTVIYDSETEEELADLVEPGQRLVLLKGGKGGAGNARFRSSTNQAPRIAELGEPGEERWIILELKLIADVGLIGLPNAGKSTLLAAVSAAQPKIADYPFTTLEPNLGVVEIGGRGGETNVMADIPGLIEGAAEGVGLGLEFLRHVERTRMLLHLLDGSGGPEGRDPIRNYELIQEELAAYSDELVEKPTFIVVTKLDLPETREYLPLLREELEQRAEGFFAISAVTGEGVAELTQAVAERLRAIPRPEPVDTGVERIYRLEDGDDRYWEVDRLSEHHYEVRGRRIERVFKMTNFSLDEAGERFQRVLELSGIAAALERKGIEPGDIVHIAGDELVWDEIALEAEALAANPPKRRRTRRQRLQDRLERSSADGEDEFPDE